jgi:predicted TIM-barrel fold metal-dependent hydrolase
MCHSGRGFWYEEAFLLSRLHKNLYMEISGLPPKRLLTYYPEFERNADKIIFGSDWPGLEIKANIEDIRNLPLKEASIEKILGGNATRLLNL